jgi:hypothetical protein
MCDALLLTGLGRFGVPGPLRIQCLGFLQQIDAEGAEFMRSARSAAISVERLARA